MIISYRWITRAIISNGLMLSNSQANGILWITPLNVRTGEYNTGQVNFIHRPITLDGLRKTISKTTHSIYMIFKVCYWHGHWTSFASTEKKFLNIFWEFLILEKYQKNHFKCIFTWITLKIIFDKHIPMIHGKFHVNSPEIVFLIFFHLIVNFRKTIRPILT